MIKEEEYARVKCIENMHVREFYLFSLLVATKVFIEIGFIRKR